VVRLAYKFSIGSSVRIVITLRIGRPRFDPRQGRKGIFSPSPVSRPALGPTQPPIQWVPGAISPAEKQPGREADHSPPSSAEDKNTWSYTSPPIIFLLGVVLN
jgi:hypothetical protein